VRRRGAFLLAALAALAGCSPREAPPAAPVPARYLYVWAGTGHGGGGSNFIAVVDVRPESPAYGQIVAASPAVEGGIMPHHTEFVLPASGKYFENDFMAGNNFLVDASSPQSPRVTPAPAAASGFRGPHRVAADPGSDRLVVSEQGDGPPRILMVRLDPATGRLSWDERFQEADSTARGVSFSRARWPNGLTGHAMPNGALFVP